MSSLRKLRFMERRVHPIMERRVHPSPPRLRRAGRCAAPFVPAALAPIACLLAAALLQAG